MGLKAKKQNHKTYPTAEKNLLGLSNHREVWGRFHRNRGRKPNTGNGIKSPEHESASPAKNQKKKHEKSKTKRVQGLNPQQIYIYIYTHTQNTKHAQPLKKIFLENIRD